MVGRCWHSGESRTTGEPANASRYRAVLTVAQTAAFPRSGSRSMSTAIFLGEGIVRRSHRTWTLTLVLSGLWLLYDLAEMSSLYSRSRLQTVITVVVLALLFSPAVRRHCTKTARR